MVCRESYIPGRAFFVRTPDFGLWFEVSGIALGLAIFVRRDDCA